MYSKQDRLRVLEELTKARKQQELAMSAYFEALVKVEILRAQYRSMRRHAER